MFYKIFLVVFLMATCGFSAHLPKNFKTCKKSDPKFKECLMRAIEEALKSLKDGNKELGVNPLDPLVIPKMHAPGNGGSINIDQTYTDIHLYGLSDSKILKLDVDLEKCKIRAEALTPVLHQVSDYDLKGQLLVFPINGQGKNNNTLSEFTSVHDITCEKFKKKGEDYLRVIDYKASFKAGKVNFHYENIINGEISTEIRKVLNENSEVIFEETKGDYEISYALVFKNIANQIFTKVPLKEIFLE